MPRDCYYYAPDANTIRQSRDRLLEELTKLLEKIELHRRGCDGCYSKRCV